MAFTPCAIHGRGYAGGASTFFLRVVQASDVIGGRIQCCANCATELLDKLATRMIKVSEGDEFYEYTDPMACLNCGGELGHQPWQFYGNAYPRGKAPSQWFGRVCTVCRDSVISDYSLDVAERRP
jgi:hypothetical protein